MDRPVRAELREAHERVGDVSLGQERLQLVAEARGREIADEPHLDRRARQPLRFSYRSARKMRVGSSMKERLWSTRIVCPARSRWPPNGSTSRPRSAPF